MGCVALDRAGNLCAGTSTGGISNKRYGRVGDSPIIGAGTYANNRTCGVSATGQGEYFIRWTVAHDISALMEYKGIDVEEAAGKVVLEKLAEAGGEGGVVCLDTLGRPAMVTNTSGMFRAYGNSSGDRMVAIF
ncbi:MAG: isoaspartyl peptidase/L-asparaginase [Bacteroidales bacterium]